MPNEQEKPKSPAEALRTWYAQVPIGEASLTRLKVMQACDWTSDQWYNSIYGRRTITTLEKKAINQAIGTNIFDESEVQP